jgi:hypothetical protein
MGRTGHKAHTRGTWRVLLALVCVLLVVVAGTVQVAHTHADAATHADCSLCVAAHVTIHLVATPAPAPTAAVIAVLEAVPPVVRPTALNTYALFTRPPPAGATSA